MTTRSHSKSVVFSHSFELKGVDRILPPGEYRIVTDEELIEELSFPVYRRVATMLFVPAVSHHASSVEMVTIDSQELQAGTGARPRRWWRADEKWYCLSLNLDVSQWRKR